MATKDDRIAWQSSLGSNGVLGIIDPVTVPRGGPGEPAENRPSDPQCIGYRTGALVAKAPEQPLKYPEPRMVKKFERATRIEAAATAADFGGAQTQRLIESGRVEGLNTVGAFSSPAFNGTSIAKSSYQSPIAPQMAKPLNLADPTRGHKPQGVNKDGTKVMHKVGIPGSGDINYMMH